MLPLYRDPYFTFRFQDDRIISRIHLEGISSGTLVSIFAIDPITEVMVRQLCVAMVGEGGWVELSEPIIVRAGEAFIATTDPTA